MSSSIRQVPTRDAGDNSETPTCRMAKLEVKSRTKRAKLASSKSLTQLVPRSLFFLRRNDNEQQTEQQSVPKKLVTCRSFPRASKNKDSSTIGDEMLEPLPSIPDDDNNLVDLNFDITPEICDRMDRLKAWPRKPSTKNTLRSRLFGAASDDTCKKQSASTSADSSNQQQQQQQTIQQKQQENQETGTGRDNGLSGLGVIFNPKKGAFMFMRNNRFVQPRCRSKQPFAKLTNEPATPSPTKLYSPFGIETPDTGKSKQSTKSKPKQATKSKRNGLDTRDSDGNIIHQPQDRPNQLKRGTHSGLNPCEDFKSFDSPSKKFRETVNYVEQSQRDIEAISMAIMTRPAPSSK